MISPTAELAWLVLAEALDVLAETGRPTPCQVDPDPFTSEDHDERQEAALACAGCPVLDLCLTYSELGDEPFHVWGGHDRAPDRRKFGRRRDPDPGRDPSPQPRHPSGKGPSTDTAPNLATLEEAS